MPHPVAASPEAVGIDSAKLADLFARAEREVHEGRLPSVQVAVARHGRLAGMRSFGTVTHEGRSAPASDETLYVLFSCTKAITSSAVWLLLEDGKLSLDTRAADVIPAFASEGKDAITVEQLLTHTAGIPRAPYRQREWDWARLPEAFARWRLNWEPGSRYEYHHTSGMWVLAALVQTITGVDFREFVRTRIAEPLGLPDLRIGLPRALHGRLADLVYVGRERTPEEYAAVGLPVPPPTEVTETAIVGFNEARIREIGVPGGGGTGTAAELALYYQALVAGGAPVWQPETIAEVRRIRNPQLLDPLLGRPANRGLGVVVAGGPEKVFLGFGKGCSAQAFGHLGVGGQIGWCDPATGLSFGFCTNGVERDPLVLGRRTAALANRAAACVL